MDLSALVEMVETDRAEGFAPFCVVFQCGILALQHTDNIALGVEHARELGIWSHVTGPSSVLLLLGSNTDVALPPNIRAIMGADSFSIESQHVLLNTASDAIAPICTFFQQDIPDATPLNTLPIPALVALVLSLRRQRPVSLSSFIADALHDANRLTDLLECIDSLFEMPFADESAPHLVVFRYKPPPSTTMPLTRLVAAANCQISTIFARHRCKGTLPHGLHLINRPTSPFSAPNSLTASLEDSQQNETDAEGEQGSEPVSNLCCFDPLNLADLDQFTQHSESLAENLSREDQLTAMVEEMAAAVQRVNDLDLVAAQLVTAIAGTRLKPVFTSSFNGIVSLWYEPDFTKILAEEFMRDDIKAQETSEFNLSVATLLAQNSPDIFVLTAIPEHGPCIGILDIDSTITSVQAVVEEILEVCNKREQEKSIETLGHTIQDVISKAEQKIAKAKDEALYQEGVLRQVPLLGSLWNFIVPLEKPNIHGWKWEIPPELIGENSTPLRTSSVTSGLSVNTSTRNAVASVLESQGAGESESEDDETDEEELSEELQNSNDDRTLTTDSVSESEGSNID
eukprot:c18152_g1_i2.p1 GENE.c18152_g1_i2~~c18152_g1_i2.p1  ORF type:complete len:571 (+),score=135.91 c18152_g1_i2:622-2334(+)